jgi:broad specificity phosphatase PhoE
MRQLFLIRHASPQIQPGVPSREWQLSERGIEEAHALAKLAPTWELEAIYTSSEPKAQTTGLIIADALGLFVRVVDGFDELRMPAWIGNADAFNEAVRALLEEATDAQRADDPVRGAEPAKQAAARFADGVELVAQGEFPAAIVSHGRVLTAWLTQAIGLEDPFETWRTMPMPGWACIDLDAPGLGFITPFS